MQTFPFSIALLVLCFLATFSLGTNNRAYLERDISVNCGSTGPSAAFNGKEWIGDAQPKSASWLSIKGSSKISTLIHKLISDDPVPHKTARVSSSRFSYDFHLSPGQKLLRLHFNPSPYKGFKKFKDLFTVEAGPFILLSNFSASLTARGLGVRTITKEFCISVCYKFDTDCLDVQMARYDMVSLETALLTAEVAVRLTLSGGARLQAAMSCWLLRIDD
ncbi:hypothetical protein RD792_016786 [Penstemon davidsonii]|uniref:Uncharacterized protein n=1 Tax=Penstemon davidsonii TaxID=160366 RepID=A0ABR0CL85_9LAMI|nr:hypothetical protein RD792_016786 [Penstemon davidsonii]